jgi:hypothetical protein
MAGSRKVFWRHLDGQSPALTEVLHSEDRVYSVFNLKQQQHCEGWCGHSGHVQLPWAEGNWTVTFSAMPSMGIPETTVKAQPVAIDGHGHTLTVYCQLPRQYSAVPPHTAVHVTIKVAVHTGNATKVKVYDNIPLCIDLPKGLPYHLSACTGIEPALAHMVPEWVAYHAMQGFEHFTVYVDGNASRVADQLQPLISAGLLTLVDFHWPASEKRNWWSQQAIQNSCIIHARGRSRWLALHDIDEFLQVGTSAEQGTTVAGSLQQHSAEEHMAAFAVCVHFFGSHPNAILQAAQAAANQGLTIGQYVSRTQEHACEQREKLIVNPHSTSYVSVHVVTAGGPVRRADSTSELRIAHYKAPALNTYPVHDASMAAFAGAVRSKLAEWYPAYQAQV